MNEGELLHAAQGVSGRTPPPSTPGPVCSPVAEEEEVVLVRCLRRQRLIERGRSDAGHQQTLTGSLLHHDTLADPPLGAVLLTQSGFSRRFTSKSHVNRKARRGRQRHQSPSCFLTTAQESLRRKQKVQKQHTQMLHKSCQVPNIGSS